MKQRAVTENVQYIAISREFKLLARFLLSIIRQTFCFHSLDRPQLYLHADRMVGTYGRPSGASLCVAADFPSIEFDNCSEENK